MNLSRVQWYVTDASTCIGYLIRVGTIQQKKDTPIFGKEPLDVELHGLHDLVHDHDRRKGHHVDACTGLVAISSGSTRLQRLVRREHKADVATVHDVDAVVTLAPVRHTIFSWVPQRPPGSRPARPDEESSARPSRLPVLPPTPLCPPCTSENLTFLIDREKAGATEEVASRRGRDDPEQAGSQVQPLQGLGSIPTS